MSEQLAHTPKHEALPHHESAERSKERLDELKEMAEADAEQHKDEAALEQLKKDVEQQAISGKEMSPSETGKDATPSVGYVNRELKDISYQRTLKTVRRHLRAPEKAFSKVIHQPVVEKISEATGKTIARPSGILGGGIAALSGSALLLWLTKKYGYEYNYLVFFMLFVGGFALGMMAELGIRAFVARKKA